MLKEKESSLIDRDIKLLGDILGQVIKKQVGVETYNKIEEIRKQSYKLNNSSRVTNKLLKILESLSDDMLINVIRAFSHFLNYANIAEQHQKIRNYQQGNKDEIKGNIKDVIRDLKLQGIDSKKIFEAICNLDIGLVLTAHPTEVKRRSIIKKSNNIGKYLSEIDNMQSEQEFVRIKSKIYKEITSIWLIADLREKKPTVNDEARWGLTVVESSLWNAVPKFWENLDLVSKQELGFRMPLDKCPIRFDSWIGGDRDGNPYVTATVTKNTVYMSVWIAMTLYLKDINKLKTKLLNAKFIANKNSNISIKDNSHLVTIDLLVEKIKATRVFANNILKQKNITDYSFVIKHINEIIEPLNTCYKYLEDIPENNTTKSYLSNLIVKANCFGVSLLRLDLRQSSEVHANLMQEICKNMFNVDYLSLEEQEKQSFLLDKIRVEHSFKNTKLVLSSELQDVLDTFVLIGEMPSYCFGKYIISMSSKPSDILLVLLLQKSLGVKKILPIVPLFETEKDLQESHIIIDTLLKIDMYKNITNNEQEVMIGYSDSAKDAGILAASWRQYCAKEKISKVAKIHKVKITFFHGRGGSVGRGGWPTHVAISALPPGITKDGLRVTQQGEVINFKFGTEKIAIRTIDLYVSATLKSILSKAVEPKPVWFELMNDMSNVSSKYFRDLVYNNKDFENFFYKVTPCNELKELTIGSRPHSRKPNTKITSLRAIPWVFAWTQNRFLIPAWFGVGAALDYIVKSNKQDELRSMLAAWPYANSLFSTIEMIISKVDQDIFQLYSMYLLPKHLNYLSDRVIIDFTKTKKLLLDILNAKHLLEHNHILKGLIDARKPYLLPLSLIQIELLCQVRQEQQPNPVLKEGLLISIAGIAAGMKNSG